MDMDRLVKLAGEALAEDEWWTFADELLIEHPAPRGAPLGGKSSAHDGGTLVMEDLSRRIEEEHGHRITSENLMQIRATVIAWPREERDDDVSFGVHRKLRGPKTKPLLAIYKKRAATDHKRAPGFFGSPRLTEHRVKFYRAEERAVDPWEIRMQKRITSLIGQAESIDALGVLEALINTAVNQRAEVLKGRS